jgi:hypothetical protein
MNDSKEIEIVLLVADLSGYTALESMKKFDCSV